MVNSAFEELELSDEEKEISIPEKCLYIEVTNYKQSRGFWKFFEL